LDGPFAAFSAIEAEWTAEFNQDDMSLSIRDAHGQGIVSLAGGPAYPAALLAARINGTWQTIGAPDHVSASEHQLLLRWQNPSAELVIEAEAEIGLGLTLSVPSASSTAIAWKVEQNEHFYGLGERFNKLDQRGEVVELWVKNGASGGNTYKPVPFIASSLQYGVAIDSSRRVFAALAHPTTPDVATITVESDTISVRFIPGANPTDVLRRYTQWIGRPPIPPDWFFRPWKSRDWREENQQTVMEDLREQQKHDIPCGVKLIDATWETEGHSFAFDPVKYPDVDQMVRDIHDAGAELVLWISPSMTAGSPEYDECARQGYLITDSSGRPYLHDLGNAPGWQGTTIDFSNSSAVAWWQEQLRALLERGIRGFKTDFGEQVPEDAMFSNGKTGAEIHNLLPVLYNQATWDIVKEYDGVQLARSAWAGSQKYPGVWAGDQSADFSPWAGLPTAIVAGQSAGWSGFPYWGSDVGGYFNPPDDEVFARWAQFGALSPVMEAHGLGCREPWEFSDQTLSIYREAARLHDRLVPYSLAASVEALETGMPLMRAMALIFPEYPEAHLDWVQYQFCYGPSLLVAPVYSWGSERQVWFPPGMWIDVETGSEYTGPSISRVPAPLDKLPLFARAGAVIPTRSDSTRDDLILQMYPALENRDTNMSLPDGTSMTWIAAQADGGSLNVAGPDRDYQLEFPFQAVPDVTSENVSLRHMSTGVAWTGSATIRIGDHECT
jgi:alpha-D-xyloside xylohydrolase